MMVRVLPSRMPWIPREDLGNEDQRGSSLQGLHAEGMPVLAHYTVAMILTSHDWMEKFGTMDYSHCEH